MSIAQPRCHFLRSPFLTHPSFLIFYWTKIHSPLLPCIVYCTFHTEWKVLPCLSPPLLPLSCGHCRGFPHIGPMLVVPFLTSKYVFGGNKNMAEYSLLSWDVLIMKISSTPQNKPKLRNKKPTRIFKAIVSDVFFPIPPNNSAILSRHWLGVPQIKLNSDINLQMASDPTG